MTDTAAMFIETSSAPTNTPTPNITTPSTATDGARPISGNTRAAPDALTTTISRAPNRAHSRPVTGATRISPMLLPSSASPIAPGPACTCRDTAGIRDVQEPMIKPLKANVTKIAVRAIRTQAAPFPDPVAAGYGAYVLVRATVVE